MTVIALYNMKGGVGKTTTAVNLSYLAAAAGRRTLLWDLDPQAASSFAFRIRPHVAGFGRRSLKSGEALAAAIKETDYTNLDVLPADFAYRKLDRLLAQVGKPKRVVTELLDALGTNYDVIFLDCPAGFSLLTEGILAAADAILVPTIPTVLSLRTLAQLIKWAERRDSPSELAAFFSMVDIRKSLHRRASDWSASHSDIFLAGQVPYASVVEQMAIRRMPLHAFAARDPAALAFAGIWRELQARLQHRRQDAAGTKAGWLPQLQAVESLIARLEPVEAKEAAVKPAAAAGEIQFVHAFDTEGRDLRRCGYVLALHESSGSFAVVAARVSTNGGSDGVPACAEAQIDGWWATQILSGALSPLTVLERRLGPPLPRLLASIRATVADRQLRRVDSRASGQADGRSATPAQFC